MIAWFGALLAARDPETIALWSRAICGILFAVRSVEFLIDGSVVGYPLAAGGTAILLGEIFEHRFARRTGRLYR